MSDPRPIMRRLSAAREAPGVTCSASRHAQQIAERLMLQVDMPDDRTPDAGESIGATVAALWQARATIARLTAEPDAARTDAERYRWHRSVGGRVWTATDTGARATDALFDAATDYAMREGEGK